MADINGLKLINDAFGHHMGDEVLKNADERMYLNKLKESKQAKIKMITYP